MSNYHTQLLKSTQTAIAAELLKQLHPVVIPTETVYGIAADARSNEACRNVFVAKGRPTDNPLIVHFYSIQQIIEYDIVLTNTLYRLLNKFAPGPLTVVVPTSSKIATIACAGLPSVALRIPSHPVARAILKRCGFPLAAPSANISGAVSATTVSVAAEQLYGGRVAAIVNGGPAKYGVESTVIKDNVDMLMIIRSGAIPESVLSKYVHKLIQHRLLPYNYKVETQSSLASLFDKKYSAFQERSSEQANLSIVKTKPRTCTVDDSTIRIKKETTVVPGSKYRHYQPRALVILFSMLHHDDIDSSHRSIFRRLIYNDRKKSCNLPHQYVFFPLNNSRSDDTSGLIITRQSLQAISKNNDTVKSHINIIKRKHNGSFGMCRTIMHLPLGWQSYNLSYTVIVPSIKQYMRDIFFFYWTFDVVGVNMLFVELPRNLDIFSSALGDRLVRSAL